MEKEDIRPTRLRARYEPLVVWHLPIGLITVRQRLSELTEVDIASFAVKNHFAQIARLRRINRVNSYDLCGGLQVAA
jgi:hypothetical protein